MSPSLKLAVLAMAASCAIAPATASADVLQIEADGPRWVAGKRAEAAPEAASPALPEGPAFTQPAVLVGPRQWQAAVWALAAKYEISPSLLEAVVWQESRWRAGATSPKGAHGLAQLMPGTARQLRVDIADPQANLEGGARYLRMQLDTFGGDVEKALAAYNAGPGRVERAGGVPDIPETQGYVAAVMARMADRVRR
jgi:soluble lytic murein transglycosylase-like protein